MTHPDDLTDAAIDALLDGLPPVEPVARRLSSAFDELRSEATSFAPNAALAELLELGFVPGILTASDVVSDGPAAAEPTLRRRLKMIASIAAAKLAALSLLGKAAVAGAAVAVASTGAGAAGVLPAPAQAGFDAVVQRDAAEVDELQGRDGSSDAVTDDDLTTPTEDAPERFGERVSGDATGETDDVKGVDGRQIADEASEGRSGGPDGARIEDEDDSLDEDDADSLDDDGADSLDEDDSVDEDEDDDDEAEGRGRAESMGRDASSRGRGTNADT